MEKAPFLFAGAIVFGYTVVNLRAANPGVGARLSVVLSPLPGAVLVICLLVVVLSF